MNKKLLYDMSSKCLFKSSKDIRKGGDQNQRKIRGREIKASEELYGMFSVTLSMPKSGVFQALAPLVPSSLALVSALLGSFCPANGHKTLTIRLSFINFI